MAWAMLRELGSKKIKAQVGAQVGDQVRDQVRDQVGAQVRDQVRDQVGDQVGDQVRAQVGAQVRDQVRAQVGAQVMAQVMDQVGDQVWAQVGAQVSRCGYGQHDAGWLSFYAAFQRFGLADIVAPLEGLLRLTRSCGWWWPFEHVAILTERSCVLTRDADGRLHGEHEAAIKYPDGWGVYAWHGVRVPERVILSPHTLTAQEIASEGNAEVRRVMIERYGWDRYLHDQGATPVQSDRFGDLYRTELDGAEIGVVVVVNSTPEMDGSRKKYALLVPPDHQTAQSAVASTFGLTANEYQPVRET